MNVFHKVTRENLRRNRVRTLVTIAGVILSAAMICGVTTIISSLQGYLVEEAVYRTGDWYAAMVDATAQTRAALQADSRVSQVVSAQMLGYAPCESSYQRKPFFYVLGVDDAFLEAMPVRLTAGRLPERAGEVLVPSHYLEGGDTPVELGQRLELTLGDRIMGGELLNQYNPYTPEVDVEATAGDLTPVEEAEQFLPRQSVTYTVVGFYGRPDFEDYSAPGYTLLTLPDPAGPDRYELYCKTARVGQVDQVDQEYGLQTTNWDLLNVKGHTGYGNVNRVLVNFAVILILIIMLGSVSLIYSAFSISVSERTRQFGLLRSIGATRRQLRRSVLYEACVISAIGIPLGILCGIGGIGVTLYFLGDLFRGLVGNADVRMHLQVSWASVGIAAGTALLTVLISAWIPSRRAMRVSAMEAIRQNQDIHGKGKDVRVSKLTRKLFGLEGMLAKKYFHRGRKRYRATIVSLAMSLVLFISTSALCVNLTGSVDAGTNVSRYDLHVQLSNPEEMQALLPEIRALSGVRQATGRCFQYRQAIVDVAQLRPEYLRYLAEYEAAKCLVDGSYQGNLMVPLYCYFLDSDSWQKFLQAEGLPQDVQVPLVYNQGNGVLYQENQRVGYTYSFLQPDVTALPVWVQPEAPAGYTYNFTDNKHVYTTDAAGNVTIVYQPVQDFFCHSDSWEEISRDPMTRPMLLGEAVAHLPECVSEESHGPTLLYPMQTENAENLYEGMAITVSCEDPDSTQRELQALLQERGLYYSDDQIFNLRAEESSSRNVVTILNVFAYGFIILISLIAAANVFNTISTNVALRRREFATLKSVGMTRKGFNRMMNYECLLYGLRALLVGLPISALFTAAICHQTSSIVVGSPMIPWKQAGIAVVSVFLVTFVTMLYAMQKIKKENPMDALKNENI